MYCVKVVNNQIGDVFPIFSDEGKLKEISLTKPDFREMPVSDTEKKICAFLETYPDSTCPLKWEDLDLSSKSEFHKEVYKALLTVPKGEVVTYGRLAEMTGRKGAARAVGTAMATNLYPLIIPCHRVIRSGGDLGNF
jgi:methylated-DNA-[protein]-cysteine S-methyltransferase